MPNSTISYPMLVQALERRTLPEPVLLIDTMAALPKLVAQRVWRFLPATPLEIKACLELGMTSFATIVVLDLKATQGLWGDYGWACLFHTINSARTRPLILWAESLSPQSRT